MRMNFRLATTSTLALALAFAAVAMAADTPALTVLDVWPATALPPGDLIPVGEEQVKKKAGTEIITSITNVSKPTLTVTRPPLEKNTGVAVLVFPGGGYNSLAWDHEGMMVSEWLNSIGVTSVILKYRVPRRPDTPKGQPPIQALMDAQRAISLVRSHATEWGVDPKKVGVLGFSAGGHLAAWCSTNPDKRAYETIDAAEQVSCRPDFTVLIYPGGIMKRGTDQLAPEILVTKQAQPTFLAVASDDRDPSEGSAAYYLALKKAGVPAELHSYAAGGHGFGMRPGDRPAASWPKRCEEWMRDQGILKSAR
jgi:acetyl esterase/lipase